MPDHAADDGIPTGPEVHIRTPQSEACAAAGRAEIERCLAAGMSLERARIEAAKASAGEDRLQPRLDTSGIRALG